MKIRNLLRSRALLLLVLTLVLALGGWYVYSRQDKPASQPVVNATDSAGIFSFSYPDDWTIEPYVWEDCCGALDEEPDWSSVSEPITLHSDENKNVTVTLLTEKYGDFWESYEALKASVQEDFFATILFDGLREDGHQALFARVDYLGPPDAKVESFTDHRYYFDNGGSVLKVEFREKYHHDWYPDRELDNSQYKAGFDLIANSIKFL